jgi:hypothetical protein
VHGQQSRLPKRFPVGATYVVEGHSGHDGRFRVFLRYVQLPNGTLICLASEFRPSRVSARDRALKSGSLEVFFSSCIANDIVESEL